MPVKTALLKPGTSQLLGQLVQVGLVSATWPASLAMEPGFKIIDFSGQASFATASIVENIWFSWKKNAGWQDGQDEFLKIS